MSLFGVQLIKAIDEIDDSVLPSVRPPSPEHWEVSLPCIAVFMN